MNHRREIVFTDHITAQIPGENERRVGVLEHQCASETVSWTVNGVTVFTISWPEFVALVSVARAENQP